MPADSAIARVRWPLMDLLLVPDTSYGVLLLAGPNPRAENWMQGSQIVSLSVDPMTLLQWGSAAQALLREPATHDLRDTVRYMATPRLQGHWGEFLALVKTTSPAPKEQRIQLIASDTGSGIQWKTFATSEHVDRLVSTIQDVVARAPAVRAWSDSSLISDSDSGVVATVQLRVPTPRYPLAAARQGAPGRVWAQYIVGTDGRVERGSIRILLTDHEDFAGEAAAALERARFRPATRHGKPARQRVFQAIVFR